MRDRVPPSVERPPDRADGPTSTSTGPTASLFGQSLTGTLTHGLDAPDGRKLADIVTARWVVAAGNRLWIVQAFRESTRPPAGFGSGTTITSNVLSTPTTLQAVGTAPSTSAPTAPAVRTLPLSGR